MQLGQIDESSGKRHIRNRFLRSIERARRNAAKDTRGGATSHSLRDDNCEKSQHEYVLAEDGSPQKESASNGSDPGNGSMPAPVTHFLSSWRNLFRFTDNEKTKDKEKIEGNEDNSDGEDWDLDVEDWDDEMYSESVADDENTAQGLERGDMCEAPQSKSSAAGRKRRLNPSSFPNLSLKVC